MDYGAEDGPLLIAYARGSTDLHSSLCRPLPRNINLVLHHLLMLQPSNEDTETSRLTRAIISLGISVGSCIMLLTVVVM